MSEQKSNKDRAGQAKEGEQMVEQAGKTGFLLDDTEVNTPIYSQEDATADDADKEKPSV
jgi:hypothetical protein